MSMIDAENIRKASTGRWPEIFVTLGADSPAWNGKPGHPCPSCGGTDRFHFTNKGGSGSYVCRGCGGGNDGFSLVAKILKLDPKKDFPKAVKIVAEFLGIETSPPDSFNQKTPMNKSNQESKTNDWTPVLPIPADIPHPNPSLKQYGFATKLWVYTNADGERLFYVCRFEVQGQKSKKILPLTYCQKPDGMRQWRFLAISEPRPIFQLDKVLSEPDLQLLVVEGEKTASAAQVLFTDFVVTTSSNGSSSAGKTDWTPLARRSVVIWPDNDHQGQKYAADVAKLAIQSGALSVTIVEIPSIFPIGWDLADAIPDGITHSDLRNYLESASPYIQRSRSNTDVNYHDTQNTIRWVGGNLHLILGQAQSALIASSNGDAIYQRGGDLVRVIRLSRPESKTGIKRVEGAISILPIDVVWLQLRLTAAVPWEKWNVRSNTWVRINAPIEVARAILANAGNWPFPILSGIISSPTIRSDGSILDQPGYDEQSGLLFDPGSTVFPPVPRNPTVNDALHSLGVFLEILRDFPFKNDEYRSVAVAAILTALVRLSLRTAPMTIFTAPKMASGKSLLADIVSMIATGYPATVMTHATNPDDERKRILAILTEGDSVVCIDNVERPVGSEALCSVLTQTTYKDRVLGATQMLSVSTAVTWLVTGNNVSVRGDMSTRAIVCHIDPSVERPEERRFDVNLYQHIPNIRPSLVVAGLTILRAYIVAGKPSQDVEQYGRFEQWSDLVRSALVWLGQPDPVATRQSVEDSDPVREQLLTLYVAWYDLFQSREITVAQLVDKAKPKSDWYALNDDDGSVALYNALRNATNEQGRDINPRKLGWWLSKYTGRIEGGYVLQRSKTLTSEMTVSWSIKKIMSI
ncbi:MAG: hypothetical protein HQL74_11050 [Magnetococcales bacterium]|nr:hypothetical protein [Magnetococcales bacterium]